MADSPQLGHFRHHPADLGRTGRNRSASGQTRCAWIPPRHCEDPTRNEGRLPGPRVLLVLHGLRRVDQNAPLKFTNRVASRALRWAVVVLRPMLLCKPHRPVRAPSTTVA